jgi:hypothetical protein
MLECVDVEVMEGAKPVLDIRVKEIFGEMWK